MDSVDFLPNHTFSPNKKNQTHAYEKFHDFPLLEQIARDRKLIESCKECQNIDPEIFYHKFKPVLTVFYRFQDFSVSRNPLPKSRIVKFAVFVALFFWIER